MLNPTVVMNHIKFELGLEDFPLDMTEKDLLENVIYKVTLPDFSIYFPNEDYLSCNLSSSNIVPKEADNHTYYINTKKLGDDVTLLGVVDIVDSDNGGVFNGTGCGDHQYMSPENMMIGQAMSDIKSLIPTGPMWEFQAPNHIKMHNGIDSRYGGNNRIILRCITTHPKNMSTIPDTRRIPFLNLCELDIKRYLYNRLKRYNNINTGVGELNLNIDDWADAKSQRQELIKEFEEIHIRDRKVKIITV